MVTRHIKTLQEKRHNQISKVGNEAFLSCMHEAMVLSSRGWIKENKNKKILTELFRGKQIKCNCYQLFKDDIQTWEKMKQNSGF